MRNKKSASQLAEYLEVVCFHPVLDSSVNTLNIKIKKTLAELGLRTILLIYWKRWWDSNDLKGKKDGQTHGRSQMSVAASHQIAVGGNHPERQSVHTPDHHHNSCSTSSNCNLLAGWDLLEHLSDTFTPIPISGKSDSTKAHHVRVIKW